MKKFNCKGAAWDSVFLALVKIITTFASIALTKILSVGFSLEQYGTYSQANILISLGCSFLLLGFGDAINYFFNSHSNSDFQEKRKKAVNTIFFLEIVAGCIFGLLIFAGRDIITVYFDNAMLKTLLVFVAIKPVLDNIIYFYQLLYISIGKAKIIAFRNLILVLCKTVLIYIAVFVFKDVIWVFFSLIVLDAAQLLFFKLYFIKDGFWVNPIAIEPKQIPSILSYSIPMGIFALTNQLSRDTDKLVIGRMTDTETLAIYSNCSKLLPIDFIVISFATVLIPYIMRYVSEKKYDRVVDLFSNYIKIGYYSVWIVGMAILINTEQAIVFLYSDAYLQGKGIFAIYIIDSMLKFASMHLILTAGGRSRLLILYSSSALILNAVLNILLYFALGIVGPAVATLLVTGGYTLAVLHSSLKMIQAKWKNIFHLKKMSIFLMQLFAFGGAFRCLNLFMAKNHVNSFLIMFVCAGAFCLIMLLLNKFDIIASFKEINNCRSYVEAKNKMEEI